MMQDLTRAKSFEAFVKRYQDKPFLLVFKTIDMSKNMGDAFDALEDMNLEFPMTFDIETNKWGPAILLENEISQGTV